MKRLIWGTVDIETGRDGRVLAIGFYYHDPQPVYHELSNWQEFLRHIEHRGIGRVYAHNGGGFDYLSLLPELTGGWTWDAIVVAGKVIAINITRGDYSCSLHDSYRIAPVSLEKLSQSLLGKGKTESVFVHPEDLLVDRQRFSDYLRADCELLHGCLLKMMENYQTISPRFKQFGATAGGTSMRLWRSTQPPSFKRPQSDKLNRILKAAYKGGRCECFTPGEFNAVKCYDVNSMYPWAMVHAQVPVTGRVVPTNIFDGRPGVWRVKFAQSRGTVPILTVNGTGAMEGESWYYTPELKMAADYGVKIEVIEGYKFVDYTANLFRSFVQKLWDIREKYGSQSGFGLVAKLAMNNLYGKMGQGDKIESVVKSQDREMLIAKNARPVDPENDIWLITDDHQCDHQHYGIAGTITSYSRSYLAELLSDNSPIYCDTDSIHTQQHMTTTVGLGGLKLEKTAEIGIYAGRKMYGMLADGRENVRIKGIKCGTDRSKVEHKDGLEWYVNLEMLRELLNGRTLTAKYRSFPTALEVLSRNRKPCKLTARTRRVAMLQRERSMLPPQYQQAWSLR